MERFSVEEVEKLLGRLLGDTLVPIANEEYDEEVLDNVKAYAEVAKDICLALRGVRDRFSGSKFDSCKKVAEECDCFMEWLKDLVG